MAARSGAAGLRPRPRARNRPGMLTSPATLGGVRQMLGPDYDVATHFTPKYNPWDQRLCLVPDADLFRAIRKKKASVVTDQIECFTETGVKLQSGEELAADLVVFDPVRVIDAASRQVVSKFSLNDGILKNGFFCFFCLVFSLAAAVPRGSLRPRTSFLALPVLTASFL